MSEKSGFGNKYSFGPDLDFVLGSHLVEVFTSEDIPCFPRRRRNSTGFGWTVSCFLPAGASTTCPLTAKPHNIKLQIQQEKQLRNTQIQNTITITKYQVSLKSVQLHMYLLSGGMPVLTDGHSYRQHFPTRLGFFPHPISQKPTSMHPQSGTMTTAMRRRVDAVVKLAVDSPYCGEISRWYLICIE